MKKIFSGFRENITYPDSSNFRVLIQKNTYHINAHWHPCVEIILPLTGTYQVTVEDSTYDLAKGDIMFLHSGTLHELSGPAKGERLIFQFDVEILYSLREFQSLLFSFPSTFMLKRNLKDPTYTAAEGLLLSIIMEARHKKILWEAGLYSLVLQLYTLLFRSSALQMQVFSGKEGNKSENPQVGHQYQEKFLAVCRYLNQNLSSQITLDEAAAYAGFSKFYFSRLFKDFVGKSFTQYLTAQRLHKAKLLLLTTQASITDIAMEAGFNSSSTFNRVFYQSEKMSPSEFRISHAKFKN
ncbi:MAG TPA: AraC family transcriptional regulator [Candidatus Blautia merdipullorum]|nr:AraC family transcriptional regulator [Candidatus Blautia merdipullorum]